MDSKHPKVQEILEKELASLTVKIIVQEKLNIIYTLSPNQDSGKLVAANNAEIDMNKRLVKLLEEELIQK